MQQKRCYASEAEEQAAVIVWWRYASRKYGVPECALMHIANEGTSSAARGRLQKKQGLRAGAADLFLAVPRGGRCGLWIEMKRVDGRARPEQTAFLERMRNLGYDGVVCHGAGQAVDHIHAYMTKG